MIPINFGQRIEGEIELIGDEDIYTFDATSGDRVRIRMTSLSGSLVFTPYASVIGLNPEFKLYNPDGTIAGSVNNLNTTSVALDGFELTQDGTYTIITKDTRDDDTGDYALTLQRLNNPVNAIPINFGQRIEDEIELIGDEDTYIFDATSGDRVRIRMTSLSGYDPPFAPVVGLNPEFRLYNPDGTFATSVDNLNVISVALDGFELTQDGSYTIITKDTRDDDTGDYALTLQRLNNPVNATSIIAIDDFSNTNQIAFNIDNFSNTNQITFNGGATTSETVLRLVPENAVRGSAFYSSPINIDSNISFSTSFEIDVNRINGGGDGFTFILQNNSRQDRALGGEGGNLGYAGPGVAISPSLVIQFDFFQNAIDQDPNNNHVGINLNGSKISKITENPAFDMDNIDNPFKVWIDYKGETDLLEVFLSETTEKPSTPLLQYNNDDIDLFDVLGSEAYIGFTGAQSLGTLANIDILNWEFSAELPHIYRFQSNQIPGTYLFVAEEERQNILQNFGNDFIEEGIAFKAAFQPGDNLVSLNRFQNSNVPGTYLYAGEAESQNIRQNFPNFIEEGIAFYVYSVGAGEATPFFRFQNSEVPGTYLYATGAEVDNIRANFPNFVEEGIAFEAIISS